MVKTLLILMLSLTISSAAQAQIRITQSDYQRQIKAGAREFTHNIGLQLQFDIGTPGENTWDFRNIPDVAPMSFATNYADPAETPFGSEFTMADLASFSSDGLIGTWKYFILVGDRYELIGIGTNNPPVTETIARFDPFDLLLYFPLEVGLEWETNATAEWATIANGEEQATSKQDISRINLIDAYGTMLMPDGVEAQALRIKQIETTIIRVPGQPADISTQKSFVFLARSGESVIITAQDMEQPDEGVIWGAIEWNSFEDETVDVEGSSDAAALALQGFPNPFNDQTAIGFTLPNHSRVTLTVYDQLGNEIAVLLNENRAAGSYTVTWDGRRSDGALAAGGVYVCRLTVGESSVVRKIALIR